MIRRPPRSTLFAYTALFRSVRARTTEVVAPNRIAVRVLGQLEGSGAWELLPEPGGVRIDFRWEAATTDRKSTRLNSSHANISYGVFCLKKQQRGASRQHDTL